jgi:DNA-binding MarR family transcriptional regulator
MVEPRVPSEEFGSPRSRHGVGDSPLAGSFCAAIKAAQATSRAALEAEFEPLGLTPQQFLVLLLISLNADISNAELARQSFVSPQAMMTIVARLEGSGFIRRVLCPTGGRALQTRLTASGEDLLERASTRARCIEKYILDMLGEANFYALIDGLQRVTKALSSGGKITKTHAWDADLPAASPAPRTRRRERVLTKTTKGKA